LLILGSAAYAQEERPYMGVSLDSAPLPELLVKHLGLEPGQGIRINNIMAGSPADKAGLERDDLIVAFQDKKIMDQDQFIDAVRQAGIGTEVSFEVIHLGKRRQVQLKLERAQENVKWKYPPEPEVMTSWRPGKVFRIGPDGQRWTEVPFDKVPDFNIDVEKFFKETYTFHHATDGEEYTITVEGDPGDKDTKVIVHAEDKEYGTTVDKIDALPEKYRGPAQEAVENAGRSVQADVRIHRFQLPEPIRPDLFRRFSQAIPRPDLDRLSAQKDLALEKIQEQMERLQQQMRELEERNREMLEKLLDKKPSKIDTSEESQQPSPSETQQKPAI
jgi:hypothetical protein